MEVQLLEQLKLPTRPPKKRVAAYARVSMITDQLMHSLTTQVSHYKTYIANNPAWEFAGIYADEGISGTTMAKRDGFKQLIADCDAGKIDMVIAKSISRFARDTVDCLAVTRHLKELGIEVFFEKEGISTMSAEGELILSIMASFAQEESRTISANVKWAIRKRFEEGIPNGHKALFGYTWDGENYNVVPEQAAIVKEINERYRAGESAYAIAKDLAGRGIKGLSGSPMEQTTVKDILSNISYTGSMLLQKRYVNDSHVAKHNKGELPMYLVSDMLEPIVSEDEYNEALAIRKQRADERPNRNPRLTMFSGLVKCGYCGKGVSRRSPRSGKKWTCNTKERKGKHTCSCRDISETELIKATAVVMGKTNFTEAEFKAKVKRIQLYSDKVVFILTNRKQQEVARGFNPFTSKIYCGNCGAKFRRCDWHKYYVWACTKTRSECDAIRIKESELIETCKVLLGDGYASTVVNDVERITIYNEEIVIQGKDGSQKKWQRR